MKLSHNVTTGAAKDIEGRLWCAHTSFVALPLTIPPCTPASVSQQYTAISASIKLDSSNPLFSRTATIRHRPSPDSPQPRANVQSSSSQRHQSPAVAPTIIHGVFLTPHGVGITPGSPALSSLYDPGPETSICDFHRLLDFAEEGSTAPPLENF